VGITNLVLVPIAFNDGRPVPDELFDRLMAELTIRFGGYTLLPPAFGEWIDRDGKFHPDRHRPVFVDVPEGRQDELLDWVRRAGRELRQEVMLVLHDFCEASYLELSCDD